MNDVDVVRSLDHFGTGSICSKVGFHGRLGEIEVGALQSIMEPLGDFKKRSIPMNQPPVCTHSNSLKDGDLCTKKFSDAATRCGRVDVTNPDPPQRVGQFFQLVNQFI